MLPNGPSGSILVCVQCAWKEHALGEERNLLLTGPLTVFTAGLLRRSGMEALCNHQYPSPRWSSRSPASGCQRDGRAHGTGVPHGGPHSFGDTDSHRLLHLKALEIEQLRKLPIILPKGKHQHLQDAFAFQGPAWAGTDVEDCSAPSRGLDQSCCPCSSGEGSRPVGQCP